MTVLPELRRLLDVSTAAPWYAVKGPDWDEDDGGYLGWMVMQSPEQEVCDTGRFRERAREDAELIVALRNHADALLDVVEACRKFLSAEDEWHLRHGMGRERVPYRRALDAANRELRLKLAAWDASGQRIDEAQCDEMTDRAGRYLQRAQAAEATVATLRDRIEREASKAADRCHKQRERAEAAEARVAVLERTLKGFARLDFQLRDAEKFERRYGIHIGGDSALGAVFAWVDELCGQARAVLDGRDGGEEAHAGEHEWYGAYCSRCGADEAGSFAAEPCAGEGNR